MKIKDNYHLLKDGQTVSVGDLTIQPFLVPGHTLGHLMYLIDNELLFTGDSIALNQDGGWCFFDLFNYNSKINIESLKALKGKLDLNRIKYVFTSHNGFTDKAKAVFAPVDVIPQWNEKGFIFDKTAPYDCFAD